MSPSNQRKPLVAYLRQSRAKEHSISIPDQEKAIRAWADSKGQALIFEERFIERGVSGAKSWRDREIGEAIGMCQRGEAAGIIVAYQDRLARPKWLEEAEVWESLAEADARLVCAAEGMDFRPGDPNGLDARMLFRMKAVVARHQWERHCLNWQNARQNGVERGIHQSGKVPLGYLEVLDERGKRKGFEKDPETAPIVAEAFRMRARGESWPSIYRYMNQKAPDRVGSRRTVWKIIANRVYTGEARSGDFVKADAHPAIVSEGEWQAANRVHERGRRVSHGNERSLLAGLIRCASCEGKMTGTYTKQRDGSIYRFYRCFNEHCTARSSIGFTKIEPMIEGLTVAYLRKHAAEFGDPAGPNTEVLDRDITRAKADLEALEEDFGGEDFDAAAYKRLHSKLSKRLEEAETARAEAVASASISDEIAGALTLLRAGDEETMTHRWRVLRQENPPVARRVIARWLQKEGIPALYIASGRGSVEDRMLMKV